MSVREQRGVLVDTVTDAGTALESVPRPLLRLTSVLGLFVVWWAFVRVGVLGFGFFVSPVEALSAVGSHLFGEPVADGETIHLHAGYTAGRVFAGTALAVAVAVPLGLAIGVSELLERYLYPVVELLRPIPPIAWVPLALVTFPTTRAGVLFVVFLGAFFPTLVNAARGVAAVDVEYRRAAASLGASDGQILRHVLLPSALPAILTGVSIGIGIGWITVVAAEMITGRFGLGHVIFQAYRLVDVESVVVGMIAVGVLGGLSTAAVARIGSFATPWLDGGELR